MAAATAIATLLFTDIEGSTRLWEREPARMERALARHDAISRFAVERHRGHVVKMVGDGMLAAFPDPVDAVDAAIELQLALADPSSTDGIALHVRCGLHSGVSERRDGDMFGSVVNRAARIMGVAHGGQMLVSEAVAALIHDRLAAGIALRDLGMVRLRDLATPEHVFQVDRPPLRADFPALRSLEATPNNLPQQVTSFVGRQREAAEVAKQLRQTRLLTLVGPGGLGKTRLSLQIAADVMDEYPDGAWLVELAPVADAQRVPQVVASVLGVKEEPGRPLLATLVEHVKDRKLLIVLDNCEHLIQASAEITAALLRACPHLRVLASSREPLRVGGEAVYPVPGLALPAAPAGGSPAELALYDAVRLFVDRAEAVLPSFRLTAANADAVAAICRHLDGIPLAIELAAARVRAMTVEQIAVHLNDRFRLLTGGDRTALPRQRTLRACIDWSYDLLDARERALFRRLSVFAGGFTLDAAEKVAHGGEVPAEEVLDLLSRLVEKSLVEAGAERERYRMLETVREYARARLDETDEAEACSERHADCCIALAETAQGRLLGAEQAHWLKTLDLERENLLAAHAWLNRRPDPGEQGLRLVSALRRYWIVRGLLEVGYRITVEAVERTAGDGAGARRSQALLGAGAIASEMGRHGEANRYLLEAAAIARRHGDKALLATTLRQLAVSSLGLGDPAGARTQLEEALELAHELGNPRVVAATLNAIAQIRRAQGELDSAEPLYRDVLALARQLDDREIVGVALLNLAMVAIGRGSPEGVSALLTEALTIAETTGSMPIGRSVLDVCAGLAALRADPVRAARFYGAAESQTAKTGLRRDPADEAFLAPLIAKVRAAQGGQAYGAAEDAGRALSWERALDEARAWLSAPA